MGVRSLSARRGLLAASTAALLAAPRVAAACSVCMSGREGESQLAFILTTIFMSVLPLGMIGGVILYVWHRVRERERRAEQPDAVAASHGWARPVRSA